MKNYVKVSVAQAKEVAAKVIVVTDACRVRAEARWIKEQVAAVNSSWLHRLFRRPPVTAEQVVAKEEQRCKNDIMYGWCSGLFDARTYGSYVRCDAEDILQTADTVEELFITVEDWRRLLGWAA